MNELANRTVGVLVEDLFEDLELWYPAIRLREAGAKVLLLGTGKEMYQGKRGLTASIDAPVGAVHPDDLDALVVPGGFAPDYLRRHDSVLKLVKEMDRQGKPVAFICHGGWVPISAGIAKGRRVTSAPSIRDDLENAGAAWEDAPVVADGNLISSRGPSDLPDFCRTILAKVQERPAAG